MNVRVVASLFAILMFIAACSKPADTAAPAAEAPAAPALVVTKADSVVIDDGQRTHLMGAIQYPLGQGGQYMGIPGPGEPAGPVTVYIFRTIPPDTAKFFSDAGVSIRENAAYLWPESAPYNGDSFKQIAFIRAIDPALSDKSLAAEFGVNLDASAPPAAAGE